MVASVGAAPAATLSLCREPGPSAPQRRILRLAPGGPTPVSSGDLYPSHIMFRMKTNRYCWGDATNFPVQQVWEGVQEAAFPTGS